MATIKTIDFSTKPICPECGREIPTDEIDVDTLGTDPKFLPKGGSAARSV